ncbi:MAG: septum site-determining protein MinC [Candidatus Kinetoplastibacterium crithidii]|nr:MAG: septum site-determining protein MinC [Candidatus Kinetoplastibacterium crithidii]
MNKSLIEFKSASFNIYAPKIILHTANINDLRILITKHIYNSGNFFKNEYIVIDANQIDQIIDWDILIKIFKEHEINILGVIANNINIRNAIKAGLSPLDIINNKNIKIETNTTQLPTMLIDKPLRSGQKIYADKSDLIVIGMVSQGAEIIADGNIHVYGPLRGKAMAGAQGNKEARIFTTQLNAELLAISGVYQVIENNLKNTVMNKPAIVHLIAEKLTITSI